MKRYEILGTTDERNECDCCGKTGLKATVALRDLVSEEVVFFGTTCAARAGRWELAEVKAAAKTADEEKAAAERREKNASFRDEHARWSAFLHKATGKTEICLAIEALGGYAAAKQLYRAA